jgi:putative nucleotidyltransferase with HDIG domain
MPDKETPSRLRLLQDRWHALLESWGLHGSRRAKFFAHHDGALRVLLLIGLSLAMAGLLTPQPQKPLHRYKLNAVAQEDVRAVGDFLVEDVDTTRQRRQELLAHLPPVFDLDEEIAEKFRERLQQAFEFMRQRRQEFLAARSGPASPALSDLHQELAKHREEFQRLLGAEIPLSTFRLLVKAEFSPALESLIRQVQEQVYRLGVINRKSLPEPPPKEVIVRRLPSRQEQMVRAPFPFLVVDDLRKPVASYCREVAGDFNAADRLVVCDLAQHLARPNVIPNLAETQQRQQARLAEIHPTFFQVKKGDLILRQGEKITPLQLAKLKAQAASYPQHRGLLIFLGSFLSLCLILWLAYNLARISLKHFSTRLRDLVFLSTLILLNLLMNKALVSLSAILAAQRPELGQNLVYALPIALGPICAALFLGLETGLALAFLMATLTALVVGKPFPLFLYLLGAGLAGVWGVRFYRQRWALIQTGLAIAGVNLLMVTAIKFLEYPFTAKDLLLGQAFAVGGGVLTGMLALGLTPVVESLFRYTSNIRLMELLNLDQPLLKELMLVAPGTYHHSLVVGQMVEAAATAIGANPLLAKAAAYYHDIGKLKKPLYFVENQYGGENKHEKLAPSMSSLILISHVKDGVELARRQRLGEDLCDIIQQHHGTCLISYFYNKAKNQAPDPNKVNILDFRYPGPRPQTKEAALVLISDQLEAASKTLTDPTPARIQGMVQKIVNNIFTDGQLDECELTLKELHLIAKHCTKILSGIFHQRISYPLPVEKVRSHDHLDKQSAKKNNGKAGNGQKKNQEDLKRLGMG